ncbi:MAG TPA: DUF5715 family protein [Terracidiphilus sp.]|nr:DUF5715 family protein [Terracidiphilus sp.]
MRLTLVLLSNLRALLVIRATYLSFLLAALCVPMPAALALQSRVHHKGVSAAATRRSVTAARRSTHSSVSRRPARRASYSAARRRTIHHRATVVRTRMPIRHYRWMHARGAAGSGRLKRVSAEVRDTPESSAQRAELPAPQSSAAEAEDSDPTDTNTRSPQEAADQIAAVEMPGAPHAMLHGVAPDPFLNKNIVKMAPLRGSLESLIRQNEKTNADNLERIENDTDLQARISNGQLVRVPESSGLAVNPALPDDRRYCRPWTATFLKDLSQAHETQFHHSFEVSSAVRTVEYQKHLMRTNGNAAPAEGDVASPHLTGATIDIAKRGLTRSELYWMRNRLQALQDQGKIDVEEEFRQSCFHITVYKSYVGAGPARKPNPHTVGAPADDQDAPADQPSHPA